MPHIATAPSDQFVLFVTSTSSIADGNRDATMKIPMANTMIFPIVMVYSTHAIFPVIGRRQRQR